MSECDFLQTAMLRAWRNPRSWQRVYDPSDGISRVYCKPKTNKQGQNYWCWGYMLTDNSIVWRHSKKPLVEESNPARKIEASKIPVVPEVTKTYNQLSLYESLMKGPSL